MTLHDLCIRNGMTLAQFARINGMSRQRLGTTQSAEMIDLPAWPGMAGHGKGCIATINYRRR